MKKLFLIVFILISVQSFSQFVQYPTNYGMGFRRIGGDTLLWCPIDTFSVPASLASKGHLARKGTTLYYWNGAAWAAFAGGGGGTYYNSNVGSAYRLAIPNTNNIKTLGANYGIILDSATSNQIGIKADSATLAAYFLRRKDSATGTNLDGYLTRTSVRTYSPGIDDVLAVGQALTDDRSIDVSGNDFRIFNANDISINSLDDGVYIRSDGFGLTSFIMVENDSITIAPNMGKINIDSLRAGGTSEDSVMVISSGGMVRKRNAADFGGSTSPAGNYGNLQINRNSAFATPASDSLGYTTASGLDVKNVITANAGTATRSVVTIDGTQTLTNKRWTARVGSTTSSATPTINTDNYDIYKLTAQTADITSFTTNLSGTPVDGDILEIQITGTAARAITWGSSFVSTTVTLPTTTVTTATLTVILQYYTTSSYGNNKWHCVNYY